MTTYFKTSVYSPQLAEQVKNHMEIAHTETAKPLSGEYFIFWLNEDIEEMFANALLPDNVFNCEDGEDYETEEIESLTEDEVIAEFVSVYLPTIVEQYEQDQQFDKAARREEFNNMVDAMAKDGRLPEFVANELCIPDGLEDMPLYRAEREYL